jgi:hypothetical protein
MRKSDIYVFVKAAFVEFHRILKDDGVVIFKWGGWSEIGLYKILALAVDWVPMFGWGFNRLQQRNYRTNWIVLRKNGHHQKGVLE